MGRDKATARERTDVVVRRWLPKNGIGASCFTGERKQLEHRGRNASACWLSEEHCN